MSLRVNYRPGTDAWEDRDVLVLYPGEQGDARGAFEWDLADGPWLVGCVTDGTAEPKVIAAGLRDADGAPIELPEQRAAEVIVSLAHPAFDPNVDEPPVRVLGLRVYADPSARPERSRE